MRPHVIFSSLCLLLSAPRALGQGCCCEPQPGPNCSDGACRDLVCLVDNYCCDTRWDNACVSLASQQCSQAMPYCVDANQDGQADVCGARPDDPGDCDANGVPDTEQQGGVGANLWVALPYGTQVFELPGNWSLGRPGFASDCEIEMPFFPSEAYDFLEIQMNCDDAANTLAMDTIATSGQIRDFELDLGGNELAIYGNGRSGHLHFIGDGQPAIQRGYITGGTLSKPTYGPLQFWMERMYQFEFDSVQLTAPGLDFRESDDSPARWYMSFYKSEMTLGSLTFNLDVKRFDENAETRLTLNRSSIDLSSGTADLMIPAYAFLSVETDVVPGVPSLENRILMPPQRTLVLSGRQGSWRPSYTSLRGPLVVQGAVAIAGAVDGLAHCLDGTCDLGTGSLSASVLLYPAGPDAYMRWLVDLSGQSTLGDRIPLEATTAADVGGMLEIGWTLNNNLPPAPNYAFTLLRNHGTWLGLGRNFDVVRVWPEVLPDNRYVSVEWDGGTDLILKVKQADPVNLSVKPASPLAAAPLKTLAFPRQGGSGREILTLTNLVDQGLSKVALLDLDAGGQYVQVNQLVGPGNAVDMAVGDLDGDGSLDLVVAHSGPAMLRTYNFVGGSFQAMWTRSYPQGTQVDSVTVIPPSTAKASGDKMPAGAAVAAGKSSQTGSTTVEVVSGATGTVEEESVVAGSSRTIRGTDIDNDDDVDVVVGGTSGTTASKGNDDFPGFVQVLRRRSGQLVAETPVPTAGVPVDMDVADVDLDDLKDVVIACSDFPQGLSFNPGARPSAALLRGDVFGLRLPTPLDPGDPSGVGTAVQVVDADEDGKPDIAVAWQGSNGGGAKVFPVRARRAEGGIALGRSVPLISDRPVLCMATDATGALVAVAGGTGLTETTEIIPTEFLPPALLGDLDSSGAVDAGDIGSLLLLFGPCEDRNPCAGDLDESGSVDAGDIGFLLLLFS